MKGCVLMFEFVGVVLGGVITVGIVTLIAVVWLEYRDRHKP